jgi:hypothetical protein
MNFMSINYAVDTDLGMMCKLLIKYNYMSDDIFSTRDLTLAATLMTLKFPMLSIDFQIEGTKTQPVGYFKFEDTERLKDARRKYMQSLTVVEPRQFMTNVHALKAEVMNCFKNPHNKSF